MRRSDSGKPAKRRTAFATIAIAVLCAQAVEAQERKSPTVAAVEEAVRSFYRALSGANKDSVLAIISRDFQLVGGGSSTDRAGVAAMITQTRPGQMYILSGFKTTVRDSTAETRYTRASTGRGGQEFKYDETVTLRRTGGRWLLTRLEGERR